MVKAMFLLSMFILLNGSDCNPQKQDERIRSLETDVKQLKADVNALKQKPPEHHYELRNQGFRTFRFDPATGETCIELTTPDDWKRKGTKSQSCGCADAMDHWESMTSRGDEWENYHKFVVAPACGN